MVRLSMPDAHMGFHLTKILASTKSDERNACARLTSLYLYLPDGRASRGNEHVLF